MVNARIRRSSNRPGQIRQIWYGVLQLIICLGIDSSEGCIYSDRVGLSAKYVGVAQQICFDVVWLSTSQRVGLFKKAQCPVYYIYCLSTRRVRNIHYRKTEGVAWLYIHNTAEPPSPPIHHLFTEDVGKV